MSVSFCIGNTIDANRKHIARIQVSSTGNGRSCVITRQLVDRGNDRWYQILVNIYNADDKNLVGRQSTGVSRCNHYGDGCLSLIVEAHTSFELQVAAAIYFEATVANCVAMTTSGVRVECGQLADHRTHGIFCNRGIVEGNGRWCFVDVANRYSDCLL